MDKPAEGALQDAQVTNHGVQNPAEWDSSSLFLRLLCLFAATCSVMDQLSTLRLARAELGRTNFSTAQSPGAHAGLAGNLGTHGPVQSPIPA